MVRGEFAENVHRKDFTLSEAVAIKRKLEPLEQAAAKQRQGQRTDKHPGKLPTSSTGRAGDKAAKATGRSRRTLEKAEAVVDAAEAEPEKFGRLVADMDRTGRVNAPYKRLQVAKQAEKIRAEPPPLPGNGPYYCAVADIPWAYEPEGDRPTRLATERTSASGPERRGIYYPRGHGEREEALQIILHGLRRLLAGETALNMNVKEMPVTPETAAAQATLLEKLNKAYTAEGALKVAVVSEEPPGVIPLPPE